MSKIGIFEDEVIAALNNKGIKTDKYYGELQDPKNFKVNDSELPHIYVDYIGDKPQKPTVSEFKFNLYCVHISFSKNQEIRTKKHKSLYDLFEEIDAVLKLNSFAIDDLEEHQDYSEPVSIGKTEKIYDAVMQRGYLTVYKREFTVNIQTI
jgi:hypothetical protein